MVRIQISVNGEIKYNDIFRGLIKYNESNALKQAKMKLFEYPVKDENSFEIFIYNTVDHHFHPYYFNKIFITKNPKIEILIY